MLDAKDQHTSESRTLLRTGSIQETKEMPTEVAQGKFSALLASLRVGSEVEDAVRSMTELLQYPIVVTPQDVVDTFAALEQTDLVYLFLSRVFLSRPKLTKELFGTPVFDYFLHVSFGPSSYAFQAFSNFVSSSPFNASFFIQNGLLDNIAAIVEGHPSLIYMFIETLTALVIAVDSDNRIYRAVFDIVFRNAQDLRDETLYFLVVLLERTDDGSIYRALAESEIFRELVETMLDSREYRRQNTLKLMKNISASTIENISLFFDEGLVQWIATIYRSMSEECQRICISIYANIADISIDVTLGIMHSGFAEHLLDALENGSARAKKKAADFCFRLMHHLDHPDIYQFLLDNQIIYKVAQLLVFNKPKLDELILANITFVIDTLAATERIDPTTHPLLADLQDEEILHYLATICEEGERKSVILASTILDYYTPDSD